MKQEEEPEEPGNTLIQPYKHSLRFRYILKLTIDDARSLQSSAAQLAVVPDVAGAASVL